MKAAQVPPCWLLPEADQSNQQVPNSHVKEALPYCEACLNYLACHRDCTSAIFWRVIAKYYEPFCTCECRRSRWLFCDGRVKAMSVLSLEPGARIMPLRRLLICVCYRAYFVDRLRHWLVNNRRVELTARTQPTRDKFRVTCHP
jgi:hypothetical protein